jgi:hypothetical protein
MKIREALAINDPECVIIYKSRVNPRKWIARTTGNEWRCTSDTKADCAKWGRFSQAEIRKLYTSKVRAYCGRTGKQIA